MKVLILICCALYVSASDLASLVDLERLYRMQRLANSFDDYLTEDLVSRSGGDDWSPPTYGDAMYKGPLYTGTHLRDQEHLEQSSLYGYQSVSGGTAEGKQNQKQVKSDKPLPAYCNPPNPCPIGYTAKDNCVENLRNTAEENKKLMAKQDCPCDTEHMFSCPAGSKTVSSKSQGGQNAINKVMDELQKLGVGDLENNPFLSNGEKRVSLVAKKSPSLARQKRSTSQRKHKRNPYLLGTRLGTVAKKSPPMH